MTAFARTAALLAAALLFAAPAAAAAPAVTFDDVLALVRTGEQPGAILDKCDTVFTLTPAQRKHLTVAGAPAALVAALERPRVALSDVRNYALIVDCSGSMGDEIEAGVTKMDAAKAALRGLVSQMPAKVKVSLTVYGHDAELKCQAVKVLRPLATADAAGKKDLDGLLAGLRPVGHTPIALALTTAGKTLAEAEGLCQVVLVTDGLETCHGDPSKAAEELALAANVRDVSVVGFGLKADEKAGVAEIARRGRGKFLDAQSARGLAVAVKEVVEEEPAAADLPPRVKALVEQLGDDDHTARRAAAEGLGKMGARARGAAPFLAKRVADDKHGVEFNAVVMYDKDAALAALKALAPDLVEKALLGATKSKTPAVKAWAAAALAATDADAGEKKPVADGEPADAIDADLPPRVKALVEQLGDDDHTARRAAAEGLGKMGARARGAAPFLAKRVADDKHGVEFNAVVMYDKDAALAALTVVAPDEVEKALIAATKSKTPAVKAWAAKALAGLDDKK